MTGDLCAGDREETAGVFCASQDV